MKKATKDTSTTTEQSLIAPNSSLTITIAPEKAQEAYDKTVAKLAKNVKLPGFRPGKVPAKIAQEQLNPEYVIEKALQLVLPEAYEAAIKESGKKPISYPEFKAISVDAGQPWQVEAQFAEDPQIDVKQYKKISATTLKEAKKEWEKQIKEADKAKKDDDKSTEQTPEAKKAQEREFLTQQIYAALVKEIKPQIPEILVKQEAQYEVDQLIKQLNMFNMKLEDFLSRRNVTFEAFSSEVTGTALSRLQITFLLGGITKEAKLTVSDEEIQKALAENTDKEFVAKEKDNPEYLSYLKETLLRQKVVDHLLSQ